MVLLFSLIKLTELASFGFDYFRPTALNIIIFLFQMQCLLKGGTYLSKYGRSIITVIQTVKSHVNSAT